MNDSMPSQACTYSFTPCKSASSLQIDYAGLVCLAAAGKENDAAILLRHATPFAGILSAIGDPAATAVCPYRPANMTLLPLVRNLVRAYPDIIYAPLEKRPDSGKKALVIGSGPAGLQSAWTLCEQGYAVTVLEAAPSPGMTLLHSPVQESSSAPSAPSPAVPGEVVKKTVEMLSLSGIRFRCSSPVGQADLNRLCSEYDIVLCACGKGAVLPADANGKVKERLFAAGTCVKNQKDLGALQAMAAAKKTAEAAGGRTNDGKTDKEKQAVEFAMQTVFELLNSPEIPCASPLLRGMRERCQSCLKILEYSR